MSRYWVAVFVLFNLTENPLTEFFVDRETHESVIRKYFATNRGVCRLRFSRVYYASAFGRLVNKAKLTSHM